MSRLLIVDDDPLNRALLEEELGDSGYRTFLAEDGDTALQILEEKNIDLVLLDIMMPRMSGLDVLAKIRESHSVADLPVIMVTAKHDSEDIVQSLNQGANDYIVKPIDFGVLQARIRTHLTMKSLSQEKDHFISIASHDLKNSLTTIIGAARVIGAMLPSNDTSLETVRGMVANIH
ncbi:MAG TPA: response regulator, partial [bacterium]|nr:response regulator [bacterium]